MQNWNQIKSFEALTSFSDIIGLKKLIYDFRCYIVYQVSLIKNVNHNDYDIISIYEFIIVSNLET